MASIKDVVFVESDDPGAEIERLVGLGAVKLAESPNCGASSTSPPSGATEGQMSSA